LVARAAPPIRSAPRPLLLLIDRGVLGVVREEREATALAAQDVAPQSFGRVHEGVARVELDHEPCALFELGFELSGGPARVAREDAQRFECGADVERVVGEIDGAEIVEDLDEALERRVPAAGQRNDGVGRDRAAREHEIGRRHDRPPFREDVLERGVAAAIEHDAEPTVVAVFEHEDDGPVEVRIDQGRGRDEQASAERSLVGHDSILARLSIDVMSAPSEVLSALRDVVGGAHVRTDPDVIAANVVDWTGRFRGATAAVVSPGNVDEVVGVLRLCSAAGVAVVPQGGNTSLAGGSVPLSGELVLDLRRLDEIGEVDARTGQVTAQAGVTLARLQTEARAAGWQYGVDLGARDVATIGGMVATNAGGVHVLRYGPTRRQLVGIEAVLADGRVIRRLDGLEKDNSGYDLTGLLCGSEGTLAVVTAARVRLRARTRFAVVALCAFDDVDAALDGVGTLRRELDCVNAIELFFEDGLALVCERLGLARPFAAPHVAYVLVEAAANTDPTDALGHAVEQCAAVADVAVATDPTASRSLWRYREGHPEAINLIAPPLKLDVALPADRLAEFIHEVPVLVKAVAPDASVWMFGHAGDGNVHVNVTGVALDGEDADRVTDTVFGFVAELHGSISAEHGIGTAKRRYLHLVRSAAEIATYRAIKLALDPNRILNPNALLPDENA
jgi:FAD/FMN-containing dehydrogenase